MARRNLSAAKSSAKSSAAKSSAKSSAAKSSAKSSAAKSSAAKSSAADTPAAKPCPICRKPPVADYAPFCSKRCADVDLHRWLGGVYAVPTEEQPDTEMPPPPDRGER